MHRVDVPDIRAKELLTVITLAEYGSFVAAAAHLKTSQPALTRTVKRVERILGVTLFARNTRRVEITAAGREFVSVAERMLNDLQLTVRNMSDVTREQRGRITISTYSAFAVNPVPHVLRRYLETRPLIEVRVREGRQSDIVEDVRSGAADFGIGFVNTLPDLVESVPLRKELVHVLIPKSHPLGAKRRPRIPLSALRDEPLISGPSDSYLRRLIDGAAAANGISLRWSVTVERMLSMTHHVCAGVGIAIMPSGGIPPIQWGEGFHTALLTEPSLSVSVGLITLRGRYLTPATTGLISMFRAHMAAARKADKVEKVEKAEEVEEVEK